MRGPHNVLRLIRTGATLERTGAMNDVLDALDAPPALRAAAKTLGWPFKWLGFRGDPSLPPVTRALTAMGPAYIKFGQILSTRPDVVGDDLAQQLRVLQDKLPPFTVEAARTSITQALGRPADEIFAEISPPVAAASIAQVHKARVRETGETVAVPEAQVSPADDPATTYREDDLIGAAEGVFGKGAEGDSEAFYA